MKLFVDILLFLIIAYYCFKFLQVLFRLNHHVIFPITEEDLTEVRIQPERKLAYPSFSSHKLSIIFYAVLLLFVIVVYFWGLTLEEINISLYLTLLLPATSSYDIYRLFAITEEGIISGIRYVPWGRMKSFRFIPIDINHRFYGFTKEVNNGYELKINTKLASISCIVISEEMKEKLTMILIDHIPNTEDESSALHHSEI